MRTENIYCDYCHKKTTNEGKLKEPLNGFIIEVGYSIGGWGSRSDLVPKQTVEICNDCFGKVKQKVNELNAEIKKLKNK